MSNERNERRARLREASIGATKEYGEPWLTRVNATELLAELEASERDREELAKAVTCTRCGWGQCR